jgi:hypothetical protein
MRHYYCVAAAETCGSHRGGQEALPVPLALLLRSLRH